MTVCVVIPALDEEGAIGAVVRDALQHADAAIVVDNGSSDATAQRAREAGAGVVAEPAVGYAAACLTGARAAPDGAVVVIMDGDGSDDPAAIPLLAGPVADGQVDMISGSRVLGTREAGALRSHQRAANHVFAWLLRRGWGIPVTDLGPMRAIRREALLGLDIRSRGYGWPIELPLKASRQGLRIAEIPVDARRRAAGESKVSGSLRASLRAGGCFVSALWRYGLRPGR